MIRGKAKFYIRHIFFIALYLLATLSNLWQATWTQGSICHEKRKVFTSPTITPKSFCPKSFLEWWSRSLRIILTGHKGSAAEAEQILRRLHDASLYLLSFKSRFLSWYYDSPEPNSGISRQLMLMLGSLQLYSKHRQTKSNIFRRCWLRAIEFRSNCWQILLLLSTLTKVIKFPY